MERGRTNRVKSKFRMSSPFRKLDDPSSGQGGSDPNQVFADTNYDDNETTGEDKKYKVGDSVDANRMATKIKNALEQNKRQKNANKGKNNVDLPGDGTEYDDMGNITEGPKGVDRWIDKPIMDVLGLSKKARAARKEKRAARVEEAKKAEGEGTETLKQAKLVKRAKKKN